MHIDICFKSGKKDSIKITRCYQANRLKRFDFFLRKGNFIRRENILESANAFNHTCGFTSAKIKPPVCYYSGVIQSHCLHFSTLTYDFAYRRHQASHDLTKTFNEPREPLFVVGEMFGSSGVIFKAKLPFNSYKNFWVAKALMSSYFYCKSLGFQTRVTQEVFNTSGVNSLGQCPFKIQN